MASPESQTDAPGDGCSGQPGCSPCAGIPDCTEVDPRSALRPPESRADANRRAVCAGSMFGLMYLWGDFVEESHVVGRHLEVSRLHLRPQSILYSLPPEAEALVQVLVQRWNYDCATWVSP